VPFRSFLTENWDMFMIACLDPGESASFWMHTQHELRTERGMCVLSLY